MTEADLQRAVIDLAKWSGYLHFHVVDSRKVRPGFPDLVLVHKETGRLIFIELKSDTGKPRPEQVVWMAHLAKRHEVYLWKPADWESGEIRSVLTDERQAAA